MVDIYQEVARLQASELHFKQQYENKCNEVQTLYDTLSVMSQDDGISISPVAIRRPRRLSGSGIVLGYGSGDSNSNDGSDTDGSGSNSGIKSFEVPVATTNSVTQETQDTLDIFASPSHKHTYTDPQSHTQAHTQSQSSPINNPITPNGTINPTYYSNLLSTLIDREEREARIAFKLMNHVVDVDTDVDTDYNYNSTSSGGSSSGSNKQENNHKPNSTGTNTSDSNTADTVSSLHSCIDTLRHVTKGELPPYHILTGGLAGRDSRDGLAGTGSSDGRAGFLDSNVTNVNDDVCLCECESADRDDPDYFNNRDCDDRHNCDEMNDGALMSESQLNQLLLEIKHVVPIDEVETGGQSGQRNHVGHCTDESEVSHELNATTMSEYWYVSSDEELNNSQIDN